LDSFSEAGELRSRSEEAWRTGTVLKSALVTKR
jgi:hypothetical protein